MEKHVTVLLQEAVDALNINPKGIYVDGTLGGAGHSKLILGQLEGGHLYAFDQDESVVEAAEKKLSTVSQDFTIIHKNFVEMKEALLAYNVQQVDGILLDLGVSSMQFDEGERGFSYRFDAPLDMRMDKRNELTAYTVINSYDEKELARIFYVYGDEKFSRQIARKIAMIREENPIETTFQLLDVIKSVLPEKVKRQKHPGKKVFQALRIYVNNEIGVLEELLNTSVELLRNNGRLSVITFHSLEDRVCKQFIKQFEIQPKDRRLSKLPFQEEKHVQLMHRVNKKAIEPSLDEIEHNPRSKSARLRVYEKKE
ncbi:MAG: 16S rRNA (cytosine(1402)-N(4))-methyltransferase RsmH [Culicoidibacterales bacterium]